MRAIKSYLKRTWLALFIHNIWISYLNKSILFDLNCERKLYVLRKATRDKWQKKTVAFFPGFPCFGFSLYNLLRVLGCRMTAVMDPAADLLVRWEVVTYRRPMPDDSQGAQIINGKCLDISKERVDEIFTEVFGYSSFVEPTTFDGLCVKKSNINATHDGQVLQCPTNDIEKGFVYQRLIDNQVDDEFVCDVRVLIIGQDIPCVLFKYRLLSDRFKNIRKAEIRDVNEVFEIDEIDKIKFFCDKIGLDYGELDVLRDNHNKKMYIVDCNTTPYGRSYLSDKDWEKYYLTLSESFYKQFLSS